MESRPDGEVNLKVVNEEDLKKFVEEKRLQVKRMMKSKNFTEIERQGADKMLKDATSFQAFIIKRH